MRAAFREAHGARLHGFAILVTLGDRRLAERAAAQALADGAERANALRHPERAAAWLRRRVLATLPRRGLRKNEVSDGERRALLRTVGVADAAYDGLAALSTLERATLTAAAVERFSARDIETILDGEAAVTQRGVRHVRRRYLAAVNPADGPPGLLAERIREAAGRAIGSGRR